MNGDSVCDATRSDRCSGPVKQLRHSTILRGILVATMLLAWLTLTNHCALSRLCPVASVKAVPACHQADPTPADQAPGPQAMQCCQTAKASLADQVAVKYDPAQYQLQLFVVLHWLAEPRRAAPAVEIFDHDPPRAVSFAESVLQRSLLSHAPPHVA